MPTFYGHRTPKATLGRELLRYTTVAAAGKQADRAAAFLALATIKPLVAGADRLTLALDDTPTPRYGTHVQGAGVHYNPTPGPAESPFVYGHVWVVLVDEPAGWRAFFCTDVSASVADILETIAARFSLKIWEIYACGAGDASHVDVESSGAIPGLCLGISQTSA